MDTVTSLESLESLVRGLPHMRLEQAQKIQALIREYNLRDCLELGFCHGVSTVYIASAVRDLGCGSLVSIDLERARKLRPNVEQLLERASLSGLVQVHYEPTSYTWRLMRFLEEDPTPRFDFCYLDGAHSWFVDGLAFFLVERLLRPGGWVLFDDLNWSYALSPSLKNTKMVRSMPDGERNTPQVRKIFELLVKPHPSFSEFREDGNWAFARKTPLRP